MNAQELLAYTRLIVEEPTASVWTDAEILNYLNRAYEHCFRVAANKDRGFGLVWFDWDNTTFPSATQVKPGEWKLRIPAHFFHIASVRNATQSYERLEMGRRDSVMTNTWYFSGSNEILIRDTQEPTSLQFQVYQSPTPMSIGTFGTVTSSSAPLTATTGSVSQQPWAYVGSRLGVVDGAGIDSTLYVTGYTRSTKTVTWDNPGGAEPSSGDIYAVIPDMDDLHHELLCYEAANRCFVKEGNTNGKAIIQDVLAELRREYLASLTPRGYSGPQFVRSRNEGRRANTYDTSPST